MDRLPASKRNLGDDKLGTAPEDKRGRRNQIAAGFAGGCCGVVEMAGYRDESIGHVDRTGESHREAARIRSRGSGLVSLGDKGAARRLPKVVVRAAGNRLAREAAAIIPSTVSPGRRSRQAARNLTSRARHRYPARGTRSWPGRSSVRPITVQPDKRPVSAARYAVTQAPRDTAETLGSRQEPRGHRSAGLDSGGDSGQPRPTLDGEHCRGRDQVPRRPRRSGRRLEPEIEAIETRVLISVKERLGSVLGNHAIFEWKRRHKLLDSDDPTSRSGAAPGGQRTPLSGARLHHS